MPSRHTLLFVDDEDDVLQLLRKTFERRYEVVTARSGVEALAVLRSREVDLLVTDQKMPEMTGIELVATARASGLDVTAIVLTAYTDPKDLIAAINQGQVYRYVTKPWDVNDLTVTVKNALEYTQLRRDKERLLSQLRKQVEALSVLYEVSHQSAADAPTYDAIVDRVLGAVARVLPYDCGAALVAMGDGRSATLRLRCRAAVSDRGLLAVKEAVLTSHRKSSGQLLSEEQVVTRITGDGSGAGAGLAAFQSQLAVPLVAEGRAVGTVCLFSSSPEAYSTQDGELLDVLANQTTGAIQFLRASEEKARTRIERMVESMADGVLLTDEKNELVVVNPAARRMLRLGDMPVQRAAKHLQDALGFYPFELVRGWEYGGPQVVREEVNIFERTYHSTITPVTNGRGVLHGMVLVLRDITEQKQLEARKDDFVSMISHELRTPLTAITGALDLVLNRMDEPLGGKQRRFLGLAKESTDRLNGLVDDLLDLSKSSHGRLEMEAEPTELGALLSQAAERYRAAALEKGLELRLSLPSQEVWGAFDPHRLQQVLNNLLTNAVKFTPAGGWVQLELSAAQGLSGFASVVCSNSGEPIAEVDLERIFDRFEQARNARTRTVRGTGLGLSISRTIVEAHGGRIWAEPCTEGARFVVVLPRESSGEPPAARSALRGMKVLVVEDDADVSYLYKAALGRRGCEVRLAATPEDALVCCRELRPEVVLLDVTLPGLDGLKLLEILEHDPETRDVKVLVVSGEDHRARALALGAGGFLRKPVTEGALVEAFESLAGTRPSAHRVLVADDDAATREVCAEVLRPLGFEVEAVGTLAQTRDALRERRPDVLLLDISMPDGDGLSFFEELKAERVSGRLSVVFLSARGDTEAKVQALKLGGDDYVVKPFDPVELGARVESVLRRREQERSASPTTQLPGSAAIEREVLRRLEEGRPFAFSYLDLDNLKAYNDHYGFAKADAVVRQTGDLLRDVAAQEGLAQDFVGHVAGDDFVMVTDLSTVDRICTRVIDAFDRIIPLYYDRADRDRGCIEAEDRYGERRQFPVMSVSIVTVVSDGKTGHAALARQAADLKKRAKAIAGSVYLRSDRGLPVRSAAG